MICSGGIKMNLVNVFNSCDLYSSSVSTIVFQLFFVPLVNCFIFWCIACFLLLLCGVSTRSIGTRIARAISADARTAFSFENTIDSWFGEGVGEEEGWSFCNGGCLENVLYNGGKSIGNPTPYPQDLFHELSLEYSETYPLRTGTPNLFLLLEPNGSQGTTKWTKTSFGASGWLNC